MSGEQGWVKMYRKVLDSRIYQSPDILKLWLLCLCRANHSSSWVQLDTLPEPVEVHPGQFITGRYSLHADYYRGTSPSNKSPLTVWRWLQKLEKWGNVNIKTNNKYSVVEIVNWDLYQNTNNGVQVNEHQMNNKRTSDEQQMNTDKNAKNVNNEENVKNTPRDRIRQILNDLTGGTHLGELTKVDGFGEAYLDYRCYLKENYNRWPQATEVQYDYKRLYELMDSGNDPVKVIRQTIQAKNKSFYELKDNQFYNGRAKKDERTTTYDNDDLADFEQYLREDEGTE